MKTRRAIYSHSADQCESEDLNQMPLMLSPMLFAPHSMLEGLEGTVVNRYKIYYRAYGPQLHYSLEVCNYINHISYSSGMQ